jgi:GTPase SAR1 family protein
VDKSKGLKAFQGVDFEWVVLKDSVWADTSCNIPELHEDIRNDILFELDQLKKRKTKQSPLGHVIVGEGGSGKTHLLRSLREEASKRNVGFIMVDLTGVNDFWGTLLLEYLESLGKNYINGTPQTRIIVENIINQVNQIRIERKEKQTAHSGKQIAKKISEVNVTKTVKFINTIIETLYLKYNTEVRNFQDVIRALILLISDDFEMSDIGNSWLQGIGIEEKEKKKFNFKTTGLPPQTIVSGLSWLMSNYAPVILAIDQLDVIVKQHSYTANSILPDNTEEDNLSRSIIEGVAGGLSALVNSVTQRTQVIVSCLEETWEILRNNTLATNTARFNEHRTLPPIESAKIAQQMISARLIESYKENSFIPAYEGWPFKPEAFVSAKGLFPREILQFCDKHKRKCIKSKEIFEIGSFTDFSSKTEKSDKTIDFQKLDIAFLKLRKKSNPLELLDEMKEDSIMYNLLQTACFCITRENTISDNINIHVESNFKGEKSFSFLHVRIRLIFVKENEREEHYCFRSILRSNSRAFQNRLTAAITTSGIDKNFKFRKLFIIRNEKLPGGVKTIQISDKFIKAGGEYLSISNYELEVLWALQELRKENDPDFDAWLFKNKFVSGLPLLRKSIPELFNYFESEPVINKKVEKEERVEKEETELPPKKELKTKSEPISHDDEITMGIDKTKLPIGFKYIANKEKGSISLPVQDLTKHTVILAGSGAGKTVLVRRLVEEAALIGIPSMVIDCANDLARLGDKWPETPESWSGNDSKKAALYSKKCDVKVWTPGYEKGNPLNLAPMPDFSAVAGDIDELEQAVAMTVESLKEIVAPGSSQSAQNKIGVLTKALKYFAKNNDNSLDELIELLSDLPNDAGPGITNQEKLAREMSDRLKSELQTNVLFKQKGTPLDPEKLFDINGDPEKTRVSVINLMGLSNLSTQRQFINQLSMTLFTWIKKNPAPLDKPVRGLLVIDEAKDFIPSGKATACKDSILRLAAQARKYGLGLIFATQSPKSIDHNIIANCTTHFYGKANSPAAISVVQEQIRLKGGSGSDIPKLKTGIFYVHSENMNEPLKVKVPLCLSYHPSTPLNEEEVIERAGKK